MIALLLALVIGTSQTQTCGNGPGSVTWWGTPSADLSVVGYGDCTHTAWVGPVEVKTR